MWPLYKNTNAEWCTVTDDQNITSKEQIQLDSDRLKFADNYYFYFSEISKTPRHFTHTQNKTFSIDLFLFRFWKCNRMKQ